MADIHAALPALEAVLADAGSVDDVVFLGDAVGYGPHPAECVDLLREAGARCVLGNHDAEVVSEPDYDLHSATSPHQFWLRWTYDRLSADQRAFLAELPKEMWIGEGSERVQAVHAVGDGYLHPGMTEAQLLEAMAGTTGRTVVCGHAHRAIDRVVRGRRLVCLPPVGQFRDGDPRPGYAIQEGGAFESRYVDVDLASVIRDVRAIGLPASFCERWCRFLETGYDPQWSRPLEG